MKSAPGQTPVTSGRVNSRSASGERAADRESVKLAVPDAMTAQPGRNFRVAGFGVCSVWMNIGGSAAHEEGQGALSMGLSRRESSLSMLSHVLEVRAIGGNKQGV